MNRARKALAWLRALLTKAANIAAPYLIVGGLVSPIFFGIWWVLRTAAELRVQLDSIDWKIEDVRRYQSEHRRCECGCALPAEAPR